MPKTCTGCVALLQAGKAGPVLAAARWGKLAHVWFKCGLRLQCRSPQEQQAIN